MLQECLRRQKALHLEPGSAQQALQRLEDRGIIVNDEYRTGRSDHGRAPPLAGSATQKVAPRSGLLMAHKRPPCASMIERQIDNPSPNPRDFVVTNGLNSRSSMSALIPLPRSAIEICAVTRPSGAVTTVRSRSLRSFSA